MRWTLARLRPAGMWALTAVLWWPWLPPAVAVLLLAGAGYLGFGWLIWTGAALGFLAIAGLLGLAYLGCKARRAAHPTKP
jgi:hypothetical protein